MTYAKPEVVVLTSALDAIRATKSNAQELDPDRVEIGAYEAEE